MSLSVQLASHLDLLTSRKQVRDRHTCDSSHLGQIEETHQLLEQSQGQVGILQAVNRKSAASELILGLQLADDRVVHVFLLLSEKVRGYRVE